MEASWQEYINKRKLELQAVILAHYYQPGDIQELADFVGDSFQLARQAARTEARVIVFCGVSFMAESAKILNPDKIVILPEIQAGCPMADMVGAAALEELKSQHPGAAVVCYVNSSAQVKALSDICCTSANAVQVVNSIPVEREIIFVPDRNLGAYVNAQTGRSMILWEGFCPVHDRITAADIEEQRKLHPGAPVVVHPECRPEVIQLADAVRSTAGILEFVRQSGLSEFIIGTEEGFLYSLQKNCPNKRFYVPQSHLQCQEMKMTSLEKLAWAMRELQHQVEVEETVRAKAQMTLERMLSIT